MNHKVSNQSEEFLKKHKRWQRWKGIAGVLACMVVFCTTYALILPAVTMEKENKVLDCPYQVHQHTSDCYDGEGNLICGQADYVIHTHEADCYDADGNLICQLQEIREDGQISLHRHSEECYDSDGVLACGNLEVLAHQHSEGCFKTVEIDDNEKNDIETDESETTETDLEETETDTEVPETIEADDIRVMHYEDDYITADAYFDSDANIPEDAELNVRELALDSEKYEGYFNQTADVIEQMGDIMLTSAWFIDISFLADGQLIEPETPVEMKLDCRNILREDSQNLGTVYFDENGIHILEADIEEDEEGVTSIDFMQSGFSVVGILVMESQQMMMTSSSYDDEITESKVTSYLSTTGKNEWQIIAEKYAGNESSNKETSADGYVRVQKNVIPTDVENEFLVYLSIDTKQMFAEYFQVAEYQATTSNNYHDSQLGTVVSAMTGNQKVKVTGDSTVGYSNNALFTIQDHNGNVLAENVRLYWSQANNVTFYLKTSSGKYILMGLSVKNGQSNTIRLSEEAEKYIQEEVAKAANLTSVVDTMGDYIEFIEVVAGDYDVEPTYANGVLTWYPEVKANSEKESTKEGNTTTTWNLNAAELVYKVRLMVEKDGFQSAAANMNSVVGDAVSYEVNKSAVLTYDDGKTVEFQKPYVRGLRYNLQIVKVDAETGETLEGAALKIEGQADAVKGASELTTGADGIIKFKDLIGLDGEFNGTFTVTEISPPSGYKLPDNPETTISISDYTQSSTSFVPDGNNMLYQPQEVIEIKNEKIKECSIILKKVSGDNTSTPLSGAEFDLYKVDDSTGKPDNTALYIGLTSDSQGIFSNENFKLEYGTYHLIETKAPDGYNQLAVPVVIVVNENGVSAMLQNSTSRLEVSKTEDTSTGTAVYTILVTNSSGYKLPDTGGTGTKLYTFGGLALIAGCLMYGYSMRRKRERRFAE